MNELNLLLAQNKNFNFIGIKFRHQNGGHSDKTYFYKTLLQFEVGNECIVKSPHHGLEVVDVVEIDCMTEIESGSYKWVVQKVDTTEWSRCKDVEDQLQRTINSLRLTKLRKEFKNELIEELGVTAVRKLPKL